MGGNVLLGGPGGQAAITTGLSWILAGVAGWAVGSTVRTVGGVYFADLVGGSTAPFLVWAIACAVAGDCASCSAESHR